ncbi:MAG: hypothetical protein ABEJ28_00895 [Salinigranum sp.]
MEDGGGLIGRLLSGSDGYKCEGCGTVLCDECYAQRRRELVSGAYKFCRVCDGKLRPR